MKKLFTLLLILFALLTHGQTETQKIEDRKRSQLSLELYASSGFTVDPTGLYKKNMFDPITVSFGSGLGVGGRYGRFIFKKFHVSLAAYYQHSFFNYSADYLSGGISRVNFNPNLRYYINIRNKKNRFFVGAGALISTGATYKLKATDPEQPPSLDLNFKYKTAIGASIEAGYELFLSSSVSIDFAMKFHQLNYSLTKAQDSGTTMSDSELTDRGYYGFINPNAGGVDFVIGVTYSF